jgi:hypothetical protein
MATGTILKPDVFVRQVFEDVSPTLIPPALPVVIVGVNNQIVYKKNAGAYDGTATSYAYPEITSGAIVDLTSVSVHLTTEYGTFLVSPSDYAADADSVDVEANIELTRNVVASTGTGETTSTQTIIGDPKTDGVTTAATLTFSSATSTFQTDLVKPGMKLFITSGADEGEYVVDTVDSETQVTVKTKKLFTAFTGSAAVTFRMQADTTSFVDDQADYLDEGVEPGMDVVIESGANAGTWRIEKVVSDIELWLNQIYLATEHTGDTAVGNTFTDTGKDFTAEGVKIGDQLIIETGADAGQFEITAVGTTTMDVTPALTAVATGEDYRVVRKFSTSQNVNYRIDHTSEFFTGSILISYTARRTDNIDDLIGVETQDEIVTRFGAIAPENPLAFGVWLASLNTDTIVYGTAVKEDEIDDFNNAAEFLEAHEVYSIVPLTQNPGIHQVFSSHVTQQSDEESKHERIVFINRDLFIRETKLEGDDGATDTLGTTFTSAGSDFIDSEIAPGMVVKILDGDGEVTEEARIVRVINGTTVEVVDVPGLTPNLTAQDFKIDTKDLDKLEQAQFIRDYSAAFANRRVYNVWPDNINVPYSDDTAGDDVFDTSDDEADADVEGFYAGCIYGGLVAGEQPQQPFTNLPITGIVGLSHSNEYFSPFQLDTMATGGTFIVVQDVPTAPCYCRHQLSTDVSLIEKRELSITKDVDYCAKFIRNTLRPYIGKYNITKVYLEMLSGIVDGILNLLIEDGQLINGKIVDIRQDEDQPDTVRITIDILVPYPANYIRVTLLI